MTNVTQKYTFAVLATDIAIFAIKENTLQVLLIKMKKKPYAEAWAMPGGLIDPKESVDHAAKRHLKDKTDISNTYLEQLYTFGRVDRDPFGRVVSVAYFALLPSSDIHIKTSKEYDDIQWFDVAKLPKLAYDHSEIIRTAVERLQAKLEYTNIAYSLLPKEFTLSELQGVYELILNKKLDKRNFRKKILSLKIVKNLNKKTEGGAHRPADLYSFTSTSPEVVQML